MTAMGGNRINLHPCLVEDADGNWSLIDQSLGDQIFNYYNNVVTYNSSLGWVRFGLTGVFSMGVAPANILDASSAALSPNEAIDVLDVHGNFAAAVGTEKGYANIYYDGATFSYEVIWLGAMGAGGAGADTYKVKVNAADAAPDYLHSKLTNAGTFDANLSVLVKAETITNTTEKLFWLISDLTGYSGTGDFVIIVSDGVIQLVSFAGVSDSFKVKSTTNDTTEEFLHDALKDNATYVSSEDGLVANATDGAAATNQKERLFLDSSVITDYASIADGATRYLALERSGATRSLKWKAQSATSTFRKARVYSTISAATSNLTPGWGTGTVKFMDDASGELDISTTDVDNLWPLTWLTDAMVSVDTAFDPPRVQDGLCAATAIWDEPEAVAKSTIVSSSSLSITQRRFHGSVLHG